MDYSPMQLSWELYLKNIKKVMDSTISNRAFYKEFDPFYD